MVKLTNLTEDFSALLHVSSISTSTPRSNSPASKFSRTNLSSHLPEDNQLSSSLSRARSEYPAHDSPPHPTFGIHSTILTVPAKITSARRLRHTREIPNDSSVTEPGWFYVFVRRMKVTITILCSNTVIYWNLGVHSHNVYVRNIIIVQSHFESHAEDWPTTSMKVVIIAAGPSGLVTCKSLLEASNQFIHSSYPIAC